MPNDAALGIPANPSLKAYLDRIVNRFERSIFIDTDPISIPHGFDDPADQEIIGLFSALLAWGRRDLLLRKLEQLCERMAYRPHEFIYNFDTSRSAKQLTGFVHRTFNETDAMWLCAALREVVRSHGSVEHCCTSFLNETSPHVGPALQGLGDTLLNILPAMPARMKKHLPRPCTGSACKRLNLYFRWMVRGGAVDLGLWSSIQPAQLLLPLDVHSGRQARAVGILRRSTNDWKAALELTDACRSFNRDDPVRYDFALFAAGAAGEMLVPPA